MTDKERQKESLHQYGCRQSRKDTGGSCHANEGWAATSYAFVYRRLQNEWFSRETKHQRKKICDVKGEESDLCQSFICSSQCSLVSFPKRTEVDHQVNQQKLLENHQQQEGKQDSVHVSHPSDTDQSLSSYTQVRHMSHDKRGQTKFLHVLILDVSTVC